MKVTLNNAGQLIFHLQVGEAFCLTLGPNTDETGDPVDYTGCTFLCQVRDAAGVLIAEPAVTSPALGTLSSDNVETFDWVPGDHFVDLHMRDSGNKPSWIFKKSIIKVTDSITKESP
jgi:hypothetical protein